MNKNKLITILALFIAVVSLILYFVVIPIFITSGIDPIKARSKAQFSVNLFTSSELHSAILRYKKEKNLYPWDSENITGGGFNNYSKVDTKLVALNLQKAHEVRVEFVERKELDQILILIDSTNLPLVCTENSDNKYLEELRQQNKFSYQEVVTLKSLVCFK